MAASPTERRWCVLEFVAVQRAFRRKFGRSGPPGMNNFVIEDASVIKERVAKGGQVLPKRRSTECVKLSLAAPGNQCGEPVDS
jgi:hypothetical protein